LQTTQVTEVVLLSMLNRRVWLAVARVRVSRLAELGHVVAWRRR